MAKSGKSYAEIVKQIQQLEAEAEAVRQEEIAGVVSRMKEAIATYNLKPHDLFGRGTPKKVTTRAKAKATGKRAKKARYTDGNGKFWSGFGRKPAWFVEAIESGKTADQLRA